MGDRMETGLVPAAVQAVRLQAGVVKFVKGRLAARSTTIHQFENVIRACI
jgi:hypothetical protein